MRIPKECYSEKFKALPLAKKIRVRRVLWNKADKLGVEAQKFVEEMEAFSMRVFKIPEGGKADANRLEKEWHRINEKEFTIRRKLGAFVRGAKPFFSKGRFDPSQSAIRTDENPLELKTHKIYQMLYHAKLPQESAFRDIMRLKEKNR